CRSMRRPRRCASHPEQRCRRIQMTKRLRVAMVGAGIGERPLRAYAALRELSEVPVLCSLSDPPAEGLRATHAIPEYTTDFDSLLTRDDIDVIDIATPPNTHFDLSRRSIEAGKHTICEKPLFGSLAEVDEMTRVVARGSAKFMPIFQYRY